MVYSLEQAPTAAQGAHLVLYDGTCGLCNRLLQFLLAHDERGVFAIASLQSDVGRETVKRFGGIPNELTSFYVVANYRVNGTQMFSRSRAALLIAGELGWPWRIAVVLRPADGDPGPRLRRDRSTPVLFLRASRMVPHASTGNQVSVYRQVVRQQ
jgi:predicted DCC family thiol-disulfide oxidoreductase YuxK